MNQNVSIRVGILGTAIALLGGCGRSADSRAGQAQTPTHVSSVIEADYTAPLEPQVLNAQMARLSARTRQEGGKLGVSLVLTGSQTTNESLAAFPLPLELTSLDLSFSKVTDAGLADLATRTPHLRSIALIDCQITDVGVQHLLRLPELAELNLHNTKVSGEKQRRILKQLRENAYRTTQPSD